jgi:SAM-dependent methyltransferase
MYNVSPSGQPDVRISAPKEQPPQISKAWQRRWYAKTASSVYKGVRRRVEKACSSLGDQVECPYCGWMGRHFLPAGDQHLSNRLCPRCGSLERYRALLLYLKEHGKILTQPTSLLDIAPKRCFEDFCRSLSNVRYLSSDLMTENAMVFSDLTCMGMASNSFDIITCLHVMEHVPDDRAAYREVRRLLKPDGFAVIVVPLREDKTFEDPEARPEEYERLYGQYDHVRIYGMDIVERMQAAGLQVEVVDMYLVFNPERLQRYALKGHDRYFFRVSKAS